MERQLTKQEKLNKISFDIVQVLSEKVMDFKNEMTWRMTVNSIIHILLKAGYEQQDAIRNAEYLTAWGMLTTRGYMNIHYMHAKNIPSMVESVAFRLDSNAVHEPLSVYNGENKSALEVLQEAINVKRINNTE